jgi:SAM-dependent methyltransferase
MFTRTAQFYDLVYAYKDYGAEVARLTELVNEQLGSGGRRLLDVACGTGRHLEYFKQHFEVEGLDISWELLDLAHKRNPGVPLYHADMISFELEHTYDVITCLFSSIGYVKTLDNLNLAIAAMARHLAPGGLLIVEPWLTPGNWHAPSVHALFVDEPELKIARVNTSFVEGRLSYFDLHYLVGTLEGTEHFVEHHELGLFETHEMEVAFAKAGLEVSYDAKGITGRGLYVGRAI